MPGRAALLRGRTRAARLFAHPHANALRRRRRSGALRGNATRRDPPIARTWPRSTIGDALGRIDRQPAHRGEQVADGDAEQRRVPGVPPLQAPADHHWAERAAEVAERVHRATDDAGVPPADVEAHRPPGTDT